MSFLPFADFPRRGAGLSPTQVSAVKPDSRPTFPTSSGQIGAFSFPPDVRFPPKLPADLASALYGLPYYGAGSPTAGPGYPGLPTTLDPVTLYATMNRMDPKDLSNSLRNPNVPLPPYDPALMASFFYPGGFSPLVLADGQRRPKNATRETTATLKAWLDEHKKNPYPTKGEKIMLALYSKMTLTQVSTWFANARRRLKKENRMTWSPRNRCGEDRDSGDESREPGLPTSSPGRSDEFLNPKVTSHKENDDENMSPSQKKSEDNWLRQNDNQKQSYQQQMLLQQLAFLAPHLRSPEAMKHYQEQMNIRSQLGSPKATESRASFSTIPFSSSGLKKPFQAASGMHDSVKMEQQRRDSVGSPSSSYDRSPSPLQRASRNTFSSPDQRNSNKSSSPSSKLSVDFLSRSSDNNDRKRNRSSSSEGHGRTKPAIWSPASMALEKPSTIKANSAENLRLNNESTSPNAHFSSSTSTSSEERARSSGDASESFRSNIQKKTESINPTHFTFPANPSLAPVWMQQYQRHFPAQHPFQSAQALAAMATFTSGRKAPLTREQFLEQYHRSQSYGSHFVAPDIPEHNNLRRKNEAKLVATSLDQDHDALLYDEESNAPINLSKNIKQPMTDGVASLNETMEMNARATTITAK